MFFLKKKRKEKNTEKLSFVSFSCYQAIAVFSDHRHTNSFMFPIYLRFQCVLWKPPTPTKPSYTSVACTNDQIFFSMFYDSWGAFWFFGFFFFCVLLLFYFFRVARNTHWIFYNIIHSKQEVERRHILYNFYISFHFFCRYNNHPPTRKARQKINSEHVKTFQDVCEVQCCVNFKSRSHFFFVVFFMTWIKLDICCWRRNFSYSFHSTAEQIE